MVGACQRADVVYWIPRENYRSRQVRHASGRRLWRIRAIDIKASRIEAVGLGEEQLLKHDRPDAAENRRVQLINGPGR